MEKLLARLKAVYPMSEELIDWLKSKVQRKVFAKGDFLLKQDQVCRYVYFIERGILSHYSLSDTGEVTTWILDEGEIATSINSFSFQTPAEENILAQENMIVYCLSYLDWMEAFRNLDDSKLKTDRIKTEH